MLEETVPKDDVAEEDLKSNVENDMTVVENENSDINGEDGLVNYKNKYRDLKRKLKCLLYEQECFHEELRKVQRKCLRVNKDKSFLLDRLLQYEEPDLSSSDEEMTSSSEDEDGGEDVSKKETGASSNRKSTSKVALKPSSKTLDAKSKSNLIAGDKVRCRKTVNGKQCSKLVSVKVKSGICYTHRQQRSEEKQGASEKQSPYSSSSPKKSPLVKATPLPKHPGGKDIGQIREAMEASSRLSSPSPSAGGEDEDDELVIDVPQ